MMNLSSFDDLMQAARAQPQPQRLLFVFAGVELPDDSTPEQRAGFAAGLGGALVPLMVVDKDPSELPDFDALARESAQLSQDWRMVFAAALSGSQGRAPSSSDCERPLQRMVQAIREGAHGAYIPFDRQGQPVLFE
jgi:hypothetical protein